MINDADSKLIEVVTPDLPINNSVEVSYAEFGEPESMYVSMNMAG